MKNQTNIKNDFGRIGKFLKNGQSAKGDEIVYISMDENWVCDRLSGPTQADAIEEHKREALGWYANLDENPNYEYVAQTQTFDNSAVLAIPRKMLITEDIRGSDIEDITGADREDIVEKYSIYNAKVIQPQEPEADHPHEWIAYYQPTGSGGGIRGSDRCKGCDLVREYDTWKSNSSNGTNYDWTGYRHLTEDEKESLPPLEESD